MCKGIPDTNVANKPHQSDLYQVQDRVKVANGFTTFSVLQEGGILINDARGRERKAKRRTSRVSPIEGNLTRRF